MMEQEAMVVDVKKLKKKFLELLERLEEDKVRAVGQFLEEEVEPYMSIKEFAELINEEGYSERTLRRIRKLYKADLPVLAENISNEKKEVLSRIEDDDVREEFIDRAKEISHDQLREEVNSYLEKGVAPSDETKGVIEMNVKYSGAVLKLISEMRQLRRALYQVRKEKLFDTFSPEQRKKFGGYLKTIKQEYSDLIKEIDENNKYLEVEEDG
jgi:hypothetical protein